MKAYRSELLLMFLKYKRHRIQYTVVGLLMIAMFVYGIFYKIDEMQFTNYERMVALEILYILVAIREMTAGFANIVNSMNETKSNNFTISIFSSIHISICKSMVNTIINVLITFVSVVCLTVMCGINFSYINYFYLLVYVVIGCMLLYGLGIIFVSICRLFDVQKFLMFFLEVGLIILFVFLPLQFEYFPTNLIKKFIYDALYDDIVMCKIHDFISLEFFIYLGISGLVFFLALLIYGFIDYWLLCKRWKKYE